jgi:type III restriction enzyme
MELSFEANLDYQKHAIGAVVDLFKGQEKITDNDWQLVSDNSTIINCVANKLTISNETLQDNLNKVQAKNKIKEQTFLTTCGKNFSIEMETGTGKTYVYLRTIYELEKNYGFKKFVIIVPSIAIKEGVLKNLQITHKHFQDLYNDEPLNFYVYDSTHPSMLRGFAGNDNIEILVINIDSFTRDENIIKHKNDKLNGLEPIEFIKAVNPIAIIDEPQNMETDIRKKAIEDLNPLCTLRYSATHKNPYNLIYSLNPVRAYDLGLVKQIEVDSVRDNSTDAYIYLKRITSTSKHLVATFEINCSLLGTIVRKEVKVKNEESLYTKSNGIQAYKGYMLCGLDKTTGIVQFDNGKEIMVGKTQGGLTDEIMKKQIESTIIEHLDKKIANKNIKILSLFFIDKVANYRTENKEKGKFAIWFEQIYEQLTQQEKYKQFKVEDISALHNGYFSQDKSKKGIWKDTKGDSSADNDTYNLIMKDKEKLLDVNEPLQFIFSHSALREGWDNPNVFQICTLNETRSDLKKRQEIGRGLRLAVDSNGKRIYDKQINRLTVVANESYESFVSKLQTEIQDDCAVDFTDRVHNKQKRKEIKYKKGFEFNEGFKDIWEKIKYKTVYNVKFDTQKLIDAVAEKIKFLDVPKINIKTTKVRINMDEKGVEAGVITERTENIDTHYTISYNVVDYIREKTNLTRKTISTILLRSGKTKEIFVNPQYFMDGIIEIINRELANMLLNGIEYTKLNNQFWEMELFDDSNLSFYDNALYSVRDNTKTIYEKFIPIDSNIESEFAKACEDRLEVKYFFKLPSWFKVPTPIGQYNPDWAVLLEKDKKLYFIAETKGRDNTNKELRLSDTEKEKIRCAEKNYEVFDGLQYKVISKLEELIN